MRNRFIVTGIALAGLVALSSCAVLDLGLDYKEVSLLTNSSFTINNQHRLAFNHAANTHVLKYEVGRRHSRITSDHGYRDVILIDFAEKPLDPYGNCTILRCAWTGYRRDGGYGVRSKDDAWVRITKRGNYYDVYGVVRITRINNDDREFERDMWYLVMIDGEQLKPTQLPAND